MSTASFPRRPFLLQTTNFAFVDFIFKQLLKDFRHRFYFLNQRLEMIKKEGFPVKKGGFPRTRYL